MKVENEILEVEQNQAILDLQSMKIESQFSAFLLDALGRATSLEDLLMEIVGELAILGIADSCDLFEIHENDSLTLRASNVMPSMMNRFRLGKGKGISTVPLETRKPLYINKGAEQHERYARFPGIEDGTYEAIAALPLFVNTTLSSDRTLPNKIEMFGVLALKWHRIHKFPVSAQSFLESIADLICQSIRAFNHAYAAGAQTNRLGALSEVSRTITSSPYLEEILQLLVNLTAQQFNYRVCTVRLLDENRHELVLRATQAPAKAYQRKRAIKLGESIAGRAIAENKPIIVPDVQVEDDYIGHEEAVEQGLKSMICVPLTLGEKPVGVLSCYTSEIRDFQDDEIAALETLAKQAAFSIEHAKLQVRDTLMQEMHHRVKNNLQQVASLMRLQLRHGQYKSLEQALNDTLARILAISSVHDLLSREDLDHVTIKSIAESLVQHQISSLLLPDKRIKFEVRGDETTLNMNRATQVALILNELVLNAIEHGFNVSNDGEVHVTIEEKDGDVSLWVANNGDKLPANFDPAIASHLGLQIVENLARALGGKFTISDILGWTVTEIKFPNVTFE